MRSANTIAKEDVFQKLPVPVALRKMIVPAVLSQMIVLIYNMADMFFVGQTNTPLHGGGHVADPARIRHHTLPSRAGGHRRRLPGLAPAGQGREDEARRVSAFLLYLGLSVATLFSVLVAAFMRPLLALLGVGKTRLSTPDSTPCA